MSGFNGLTKEDAGLGVEVLRGVRGVEKPFSLAGDAGFYFGVSVEVVFQAFGYDLTLGEQLYVRGKELLYFLLQQRIMRAGKQERIYAAVL